MEQLARVQASELVGKVAMKAGQQDEPVTRKRVERIRLQTSQTPISQLFGPAWRHVAFERLAKMAIALTFRRIGRTLGAVRRTTRDWAVPADK